MPARAKAEDHDTYRSVRRTKVNGVVDEQLNRVFVKQFKGLGSVGVNPVRIVQAF